MPRYTVGSRQAEHKCYGPGVISVTVTKGGQLKGSRLYRTSGTIKRGVAESRRQFSTWERGNIKTDAIYRYADVPTYSAITIGRSYVFKYTVPTVK